MTEYIIYGSQGRTADTEYLLIKNTDKYFREGYIYNKGFFGIEITSKNDKGNAAAEFKIIGSSLRIEIYEGQTLPSGNYIYVYSDTTGAGELIGDIYITKTDDKPEFTYTSYYDD